MKALMGLVLIGHSVLAAQQPAAAPETVMLAIRSADTRRVVNVDVDVQRGLFGSLGVLLPARGTVHCGLTGCTATTPAVLKLTVEPGRGIIRVSDRSGEVVVTILTAGSAPGRTVARGRTIAFARDADGKLTVDADRASTRF